MFPNRECQQVPKIVSRVLDLSGFVARNLSGCHSRLKEVADETGEAVTGDTEDVELELTPFRGHFNVVI